MNFLFQFCRILGFCLAGETLHAVIPLPIPASVYGLVLLLLALKTGLVKLHQVKQAGGFLSAILPLLFVPGAAGVMDLWGELGEIWLPVVIALLPVTVFVMAVAGRTTQAFAKKEDNHAE